MGETATGNGGSNGGSVTVQTWPGKTSLSDEAAKAESGIPAVIEAAQAATAPHDLGAGFYFAQGQVINLNPELEKLGDAPRRAKGVYQPATLEAFIAYVAEKKATKGLSIWVEPTPAAPKVVALLNDHDGIDTPAWRDYRVETALELTEEWKHWLGKDDELMPQAAFAEHVEDGIAEILEPDAAQMLEIAQSIQLATSATIRNAQRLTDGRVKFVYDEEIEGKAGEEGEYSIPTEFKLLIAPFLGEEAREIGARFRYRHNRGGEISIGYKLNRPNQVLLDALGKIQERLTGEFGSKVYMGAPPA